MTNVIPLTKFGLQMVAGLGIGKIIGETVRNNVSVVTTFDKVKVFSGSFVIGAIVTEQSSRYIDRTTDNVVDWLMEKNIIDSTTK